jgi:hypothetical protein
MLDALIKDARARVKDTAKTYASTILISQSTQVLTNPYAKNVLDW